MVVSWVGWGGGGGVGRLVGVGLGGRLGRWWGFSGIVVGQNMGAAAASSFALVLLFNGKSVVSVLTGWCAQRPSGRCAGSGPETAASACSSSLVL